MLIHAARPASSNAALPAAPPELAAAIPMTLTYAPALPVKPPAVPLAAMDLVTLQAMHAPAVLQDKMSAAHLAATTYATPETPVAALTPISHNAQTYARLKTQAARTACQPSHLTAVNASTHQVPAEGTAL